MTQKRVAERSKGQNKTGRNERKNNPSRGFNNYIKKRQSGRQTVREADGLLKHVRPSCTKAAVSQPLHDYHLNSPTHRITLAHT
jgi:hypothetical protein